MSQTSKHGGARPGTGPKPKFQNRARVVVDFEATDRDAIDALARRAKCTRTDVVRAAVKQYLELG